VHLSDGELQALLDGEASPERHRAATAHLLVCSVCAARAAGLTAAQQVTAELLAALDAAVPPLSVDAVIARAADAGWSSAPPRRRTVLAAGVAALLLAVMAAAAIPGSPVRRYVARLLGGPRPPQHPAAQGPQVTGSGVAFVPAGRVAVLFSEPQASGAIRISFGVERSLRIAHVGGPAAYVLTAEGIAVDNRGSGASYDITIPESVTRVDVRVGARLVFVKDGTRIATLVTPDTGGVYVIPFSLIERSSP
jgi:anti-sigma factor RsiW